MSHILFNKVKSVKGLTFTEKTILFHLADASYDHETVSISIQRLSSHAGCSERTAQRDLRRLEQHGKIISEGRKVSGRGWVHKYRFNLDPPVEEVEEEPPITETLPSTNGHRRRNDLADLITDERYRKESKK